MRRLVIAGIHSGVGKTTVACALLAAWHDHGHRVQPFKVGPDYLDPSHHEQAAGRVSRSLDSVLLPEPTLRRLFAQAADRADVSVIEGVMGLFDGRNDGGEVGSTAQVAKLVQAPVVVVIDVARMGRTVGAIARGCVDFDPELEVAGFILNRVASPTHGRIAREAVEAATGRPVLGVVPRDAELALPERHLGLVPGTEHAWSAALRARFVETARAHLDLPRLWAIAERPPLSTLAAAATPRRAEPVTIAVARDTAFSFYYEDSLDVLREAGAELVSFSPLADQDLPPGTQGVYLGGGFPELFADALADNQSLHGALRAAAARGVPMYGECGGLMYLGQTLTDFDGRSHTMSRVLPLGSVMERRRPTLGYRTATALRANLLATAGAEVLGHEFHYSRLCEPVQPSHAAYRLREVGEALEGYASGPVLASYVHLHFGSDPRLAARFVAAAAEVARQ